MWCGEVWCGVVWCGAVWGRDRQNYHQGRRTEMQGQQHTQRWQPISLRCVRGARACAECPGRPRLLTTIKHNAPASSNIRASSEKRSHSLRSLASSAAAVSSAA